MKEQRFKVGNEITYKSINDCIGYHGGIGEYYHGGEDQGGYVGVIRKYYNYDSKAECWSLSVTIKGGGNYEMLESEFVEYGQVSQTIIDNFPTY